MKTKPKNLSATSSSAPPRANLSGWQTVKLGEVCEFQRGLTYAKGDEVASSSNIVLRANNIDLATNLLDLTELKYIRDEIEIPPAKLVKPGSLMICTASGSKTHLGKVALIEEDYGYAFGGFMGLLTPRADVVPNYLFHLMTSQLYKSFIAELSDGANINNLKFDDLAEFAVPLPPLPEQRRIVGILDEALAGIAAAKAHAERNRQNARSLFESHLHAVFSHLGPDWEQATLGSIYDVRDGTHDSPKYVEHGYPLITSKNLERDGLSFDDVKLISDADFAKINERSAVHKGDVLFAMIGTIGNPTLVEVEPKFAIKNVALFKVSDVQSGSFLRYYLSSQGVLSKMHAEAKGTTQRFVGLGYLRSFPIRVPLLSEQQRIVNELDALAAETRRLEGLYERKAAALAELKQSLLHQAFSGGFDGFDRLSHRSGE